MCVRAQFSEVHALILLKVSIEGLYRLLIECAFIDFYKKTMHNVLMYLLLYTCTCIFKQSAD